MSLVDGGVKVVKTGAWNGFKFQNIKFGANATYIITMDITLLKTHDWDKDNFFFTFGDGTEYKVATNIGGQIALNETKTVTFTVTLGDYADYVLDVSVYGGDTEFIIDNLVIENYMEIEEPEVPEEPVVTEIDLTKLNSKYENDFSKETANFVTSGSATVEVVDGALKVTKTAQWQGLKGVNFKFAKNMTYKFSFDLTVSKMGSTDYFELLFADGTAEKVNHGLATYVKVGETVKVEFYVTLLVDATEFLIGCWDGGAEYTIDNFVIENTVEPVDLTQLGTKNTFTFDESLSYVSANNELINKEFEPNSLFTFERREIIKKYVLPIYFDEGSDQMLGKNIIYKLGKIEIEKSIIDDTMGRLRKALIKAVGGRTYGSDIFYIESCVYLMTLYDLLTSGHMVWLVYDAFYSNGLEDEETYKDMVSNSIKINFKYFMEKSDFRQFFKEDVAVNCDSENKILVKDIVKEMCLKYNLNINFDDK